jgi:hypothetical protein
MAGMPPDAVEVGAKQKESVRSVLQLVLTTAFALLAGIKVDRGIQYFCAEKNPLPTGGALDDFSRGDRST